MTNKVDDTVCPLCKKENRCDVNAPTGCWCMNTKVPQPLLDKVPEHLKKVSCICNQCIEDFYQRYAQGNGKLNE